MTTNQSDHDRFLPRVRVALRPTVASVVLLFSLAGSPPAQCAPAVSADEGGKSEGIRIRVAFGP